MSTTPSLAPERLNAIAREARRIASSVNESPEISMSCFDKRFLPHIEQFLGGRSHPAPQVGHLPPKPSTLRGQMGALLVRLVKRALFWYTDQINRALFSCTNEMKEIHTQTGELFRHVAQELSNLEQDRAESQRREAQIREKLNRATGDLHALAQDHAAAQQRETQMREELNRAITRLRVTEQELDEQVRSMNQATEALRVAVEAEKTALREQFESAIQSIRESVKKTDLLTRQTRAMLQAQESRVSLLMRRQTVAPAPVCDASENACAELDTLYVAFEDAFRGARNEIKERVAEYLPLLTRKGIGTPLMPVLDLGCGRGEWLEVLAENGLTALGVDSNESCARECRERGLNVRTANALTFLQELPEQSQGVVTAFHVIEHLPFQTLLDLLDEAVRVLKPGGVLILETPNPANLIVGSHTFYLDPTHVRPVPAELLRFFVESRGFCGVEIRPLHPFPESYHLDENTKSAAVLNDLVYGARDYAVVGERP